MAPKQGLAAQTIIYLLRNDLRLHDNECFHYVSTLAEKCQKSQTPLRLVPLYCFQQEHYVHGTYHFGFSRVGQPRARFILESVKDLKSKLQSKGSDLVIRSCYSNKSTSSPASALQSIIEQLGPESKNCTLIFHQEATWEELNDENSLKDVCQKYGIHVKSFWGTSLYHRDDLPFRGSSLAPNVPDTYTQFRKAVETQSKVRPAFPTPNALPPLPGNISSDELPNEVPEDHIAHSAFPFKGGETSGLNRLNDYLWGTDAVATYKATRNGLVGTDYSTKFSPWLANGTLSPRAIYWEIKKYEKQRTANDSTYWVIFELIWRDFFRFVCLKYGDKVFYAGGLRGEDILWKQDMDLFEKWKNGTTGVPFIDANMRELLKTGWMSNRGRQNVASFLVKDLKLDWRLGAEWFESMLLDHDVCSNYGNWNYAAGIGNDPRENRKFNIIKQGLDYDPDGDYVKMWVPEIANLANQSASTKGKIHFPWRVKATELKNAGIELGVTYPHPMITAGEWSKHYDKVMNKSGGASNYREPKQKNPGPKKNRGIDFYFKPANK